MAKLTPMMAQYKEIKEKYPDAILMFRLGDFYEMFFEDAREASAVLQITLTARGKGEAGVPMCGVPYHAVQQYLAKLTRAGKKVAICDQMSEPGNGLVEREVVRVVTPGTTFDDSILESRANNYVACLVSGAGERFGFAYADVTTGEFRVTEMGLRELEAEVGRTRPAECVGGEEVLSKFREVFRQAGVVDFIFEYFGEAKSELKKHFGVANLEVFGLKSDLVVQAGGMLLKYLSETQKTDLKHITKIIGYDQRSSMALDESCIRNLELLFTNRDGKREGSLISVLDHTCTTMGGRMLRNWLLSPLLDANAIQARLDEVEKFVAGSSLMRSLRDELKKLFDIERLLSRLSLGTANARDLVAMKKSLEVMPELVNLLGETGMAEGIEIFDELVALIERAIVEEAPAIVREGGMICDGYNEELDDLRSISREGKSFIKSLQEREIKRTGVSSLKVKYNKVFGYYIEISKANLGSVPEDYMRKQTLVNAERFITPELKEYEEKVLGAEDKIKELEFELFYEVRMKVVEKILEIQRTAAAVARVDVLSTFAFNAEKFGYSKPLVVDSGISVEGGRHPVVEQLVDDFVSNDCAFAEDRRFLLITGPNMGGKSTYLRMVALIVLMAQIGSFVPASAARMAPVDRIFTRVGASDNLVRGQSTFMVEMQEAAYILNQATERSLVILDEIGRGTSTYDGVSIAWAITEYLHDTVGCAVLFASHYHELIELAERLACAANLSVDVRENEREGVVFLYKVVEGGVDKSYGIEVAKLAGLPVDVVGRARGVLGELEKKHIGKGRVDPNQIGMFERDKGGLSERERGVLKALDEIDPKNMTPMEALAKLDEIKKQ